jgi:hypothetical protein
VLEWPHFVAIQTLTALNRPGKAQKAEFASVLVQKLVAKRRLLIQNPPEILRFLAKTGPFQAEKCPIWRGFSRMIKWL